MEKQTVKIAFYGKGGIGKSTIAANVSAALGADGKRVLHIGCDPKADSTRCLTEKKIPTVLEQINRLGEKLSREDIVFPGVFGVSCVEAGGPRAGSGCAGMGITAMEEELNRLNILEESWDAVIYDVLGDVVCGGFSVPMRKHYVQKVFVVTSADFMSLYAANNIMKGIKSCCGEEGKMLGGLILNHCQSDADREIAELFSERTGAKVLFGMEESREIKLSDYRKTAVLKAYPQGKAAKAFRRLSGLVTGHGEGTLPQPLDEEEMERFGQTIFEKKEWQP